MKGFAHFLTLGLLKTALMVAGSRASAQQFSLSVTPSVNSIMVSNSLTYTINVTNLIGYNLTDAVVTNAFPPSVQILSVTYSQGSYSVSNNVVLFDLGNFLYSAIAQLTVTAEPTAVGSITNAVTVASAYTTNTAFTNVVVQVTNLVIQADLGVTMTGPSQTVITNDWMTYGDTVTNAGPSAAPNVLLTNTLPPGVLLKGILPNLTYTSAGSNMIFNLGTLISGGSANLQFTVEPTNIATLMFSASVGAPGVTDTNTANNFASTNITVTNYLSAMLVAVTNSAQSTNFVLGLLEQAVTVSNAGPSVPAVRVVVTDLAPTNRLFNAVGTNNGNPFVYYSTALPTNQSANLLLQYFPRKSFPFTNSQLQAFAVPAPNWAPPAATVGTNLISRIVQLPNGNMLIEWPSTVGQTYTVVYSTNVTFSNAMIAPPSIVAPANDMEWIDYGPPTTVSAPTNATARFYRVIQNP